MLLGDFNFYISHDCDARKFLELVDRFNLVQCVDKPTGVRGHPLDLVLIRASDHSTPDVSVDCMLLTDHSWLSCNLDIT